MNSGLNANLFSSSVDFMSFTINARMCMPIPKSMWFASKLALVVLLVIIHLLD